MATTMRDITRKVSDAHTSPPVQGQAVPPPADLPLDTCGGCEASLFGAFEGPAAGDEEVHKSPDRRAHEANGTSQPALFKCRHCGQIMRRPPNDIDAQVTAI